MSAPWSISAPAICRPLRSTGSAPTMSAGTSSPASSSACASRCCWRWSCWASRFRSARSLGLLAGYFGGWVEIVIMRLTDIALAIPPLVMALAVAAVLSPSLINSMLAIAALWWTWHTRLIYSITRQLRAQEFVEAAETLGASKFHILFREILPNCVSALAVKTSLDAGFVILVGASLSFLGLGIQPPTPGPRHHGRLGRGLPARLLVGIACCRAARSCSSRSASTCSATACATCSTCRRCDDAPFSPSGTCRSVHHLWPDQPGAARGVARRARRLADRAGRRKRLGQDRDDEGDHGPAAQPPARITGGEILFDGPRPADHAGTRAAEAARHRHVHGVPGPDVLAQPGLHDRRPDGHHPEIRRPPPRPRARSSKERWRAGATKCSARSACATPSGSPGPIRSCCRAACASAC